MVARISNQENMVLTYPVSIAKVCKALQSLREDKALRQMDFPSLFSSSLAYCSGGGG